MTLSEAFQPFRRESQLYPSPDRCETATTLDSFSAACFPENPLFPLDDPNSMRRLLSEDMWADDLETIAPHLWILSTQSSANVNPLHRQRVKGRHIMVTEDPRLHLVWIHDRIFIKPLPKYLLSRDFWDKFLLELPKRDDGRRDSVRQAAMGYLRTYRHLIKHESDFRIAQQDGLHLVPPHVAWPDFCHFLRDLQAIEDAHVSQRYQYGELRLSRLNLYAPLLLRKFYYEQIYGEYSDYFTRLYGPIIFSFTMVTTILNSLQLQVAVDQASTVEWTPLWQVYRWLGVVILSVAATVLACIVLLWGWLVSDEWIFAIKCRFSEKRRRLLYSSKC